MDLIFTDPPYPKEYLPCFGWLANEAMRVLKPGGFVLAMSGKYYLNKIYRMFEDSGLCYHWDIAHIGNKRMSYMYARKVESNAKSILVYCKGNALPRCAYLGQFIGAVGNKEYHHWGQDVESARYYVDCFSAPGDLVVDPFIGGGTTAVACELIGRRCVSLDIDPAALLTTRARMLSEEIPVQALMAI